MKIGQEFYRVYFSNDDSNTWDYSDHNDISDSMKYYSSLEKDGYKVRWVHVTELEQDLAYDN